MVSAFDRDRAADSTVLAERLDNLRLALGADRLALARRLSSVAEHRGAGPFEVLGSVGRVPPPSAEIEVPVEVVHRLMTEARPLDLRHGSDSSLSRVLRTWRAERLLAWPLPRDRRPSIFAVALLSERDPGPVRIRTALSGLEALARALAPPDWLPLARPTARDHATSGLACALLRGGSSAAVELRREVAAAKSRPGALLIEGPAGSGRNELARALFGQDEEVPSTEARELLSAEVRPVGPRVVSGLEELDGAEQARLRGRLREEGLPRWIFLATDDLRRWVEAARFRSDLYWELASRRVRTAPLHERREDIVEIFTHLWRDSSGDEIELEPEAAECLRQAAWPGHYQQLRAEMRRLASRHPRARLLRRRWLSAELRRSSEPSVGTESLSEALERFERDLLQRALRVAEGNKTLAARRLRVSRQGLYRKLKQHGLIPVERGDRG